MNRQPYYHAVFRFLVKFRFIAWCLGYLMGRSLKNAQAISQGSSVCLVLKSSRLRGDIGFLEREARRKQSNLIFVQVPDNWLGRFYRWFYWRILWKVLKGISERVLCRVLQWVL